MVYMVQPPDKFQSSLESMVGACYKVGLERAYLYFVVCLRSKKRGE